jgi:Na+-driven multidrug efflux pump
MIRADGSPKYAMIAMLLGALLNIGLDPLFIYVFRWGIKGAAWATVIGQIVSFLVCAVYFIKPKSFILTKKSFLIDFKVLKNLVLLGASTFITQVSIAILSLVSNMMLAKYGSLSVYGKDIPISVFNIITKVFTIVLNIIVGIILGGQPIFGYNYGARKFDRVKKTYKIVLFLTIIIGVISTLFFQLFPRIIVRTFGSGNELYFEFAEKTFRIYLSLLIVTCVIKMSSIFFQSIGKPVYSFVSSIIRDIVFYIPLVFILTSALENKNPGSGINGIIYAAPIADLMSVFIIIVLTYSFFKSLNKEEKYNLIED